MNSVTVNRGQGGLGRAPLGQDFISGLILYGEPPTASYSAYSSGTTYFVGQKATNGGSTWVSIRNFNKANTPAPGLYWQLYVPNPMTSGIAKFGGYQDAINAGIVPVAPGNYSDEVPATGNILITTVGAAGDVLNVYFQEPFVKVLLASYTLTSADNSDSSGDTLATNLTAAINANSSTGYLAIVDGSTANQVDIYARPGLGIYPNTKSVTIQTLSTTFASTITAFASGVASVFTAWYYHILRYFTQSPNTSLWVGIFDESVGSGYLFPEIPTLATASGNSLRQCGIYVNTAYASQAQTQGYITAIQAQINALITAKLPAFSCLLGTDLTGISGGVAVLTPITVLNSEHVSIVIGQDGAAQGAAIYAAQGFSVTQLGDVLGLVSTSQVSDSIAWVATYTLSPDGIENAVPAMCTGELLSALTQGTINSVDANGYIFGRQFPNNSPNGTFVNNPYTCTLSTSDYSFIQNCRTIDKAARNLQADYTLELAAPLVVNPDGTLTNASIAYFEGVGEQALQPMAQNNPNTGRPEISGYTITVDPAQNILTSSVLVVSASVQPIGVANNIVINLQFVVSL